MKTTTHECAIDDPNAPARLKGLAVTVTLKTPTEPDERGTLSVEVNMPDDATSQEIAYFKFSVGEYIDRLRASTGVGMELRDDNGEQVG